MASFRDVLEFAAGAQPPRSGRGSTAAVWRRYADAAGYRVPVGATRAQVIALVDAGPPRGPNRAALEATVEALATGREHLALVEAARQLADVVDQSVRFDDHAWREYRLAIQNLMGAVDDGPDPYADLVAELRASVHDGEDAEP